MYGAQDNEALYSVLSDDDIVNTFKMIELREKDCCTLRFCWRTNDFRNTSVSRSSGHYCHRRQSYYIISIYVYIYNNTSSSSSAWYSLVAQNGIQCKWSCPLSSWFIRDTIRTDKRSYNKNAIAKSLLLGLEEFAQISQRARKNHFFFLKRKHYGTFFLATERERIFPMCTIYPVGSSLSETARSFTSSSSIGAQAAVLYIYNAGWKGRRLRICGSFWRSVIRGEEEI